MKGKTLISVVIPLRNEKWSIAALWGKLAKLRVNDKAHDYEFLFINDASTDGTELMLESIASTEKTVKIINFSRKFGVTQALLAGFSHAKGEVVATLDGSLQNEPNDIPALIQKLDDGYDICVGWRKSLTNRVLTRDLPNRILNKIISSISGFELHDYECSIKVYRFDTVKNLNMHGESYKYIPVYAYWQGAKIVEHPVTQHPRVSEQIDKDSSSKRTLKTLFDLVLLKFFSRFSQSPLYLFGSAGIFSFGLSFLTFLLMLYYKYFEDTAFVETPLPLVVVLGGVVGVLLILVGVLAEFVVRILYMTRSSPLYTVKSTQNL